MNRKQIIPILLVVLVGGGVFWWSHHSRQSESDTPDENVSTVVTVQVGQLRRATLHGYVTGYGSVQPAPAAGATPAATARVASPVAGVVKRVVAAAGMEVKAGTLLVELEDRAAQVAAKIAREAADRQRKLFAENNTSQKNLQDAEAQFATAQAQLALLHLTAPLTGTITHLNVRPGEAVDLTTVVAEITDLSRLVLSADIPSSEAGRLKIGDVVTVLGAKPVTATLSYVSPAVDPATDTVNINATLPENSGLSAGAAVQLKVTTEEHADVIAAPVESVVTNNDGQAVVAVVKNDEATQVSVKVGLHDGNLIEVSGAGLNPGDTVVTVGAYGLPEKTKVQFEKPTPAAP